MKSALGDGLDFKWPDQNSLVDFNPLSGFFTSFPANEDDIRAGGGVMPNGAFAGNFEFHVHVPDGISSFIIRQSPIAAPAPALAAWTLFAVGLLPLMIGLKSCPMVAGRTPNPLG